MTIIESIGIIMLVHVYEFVLYLMYRMIKKQVKEWTKWYSAKKKWQKLRSKKFTPWEN